MVTPVPPPKPKAARRQTAASSEDIVVARDPVPARPERRPAGSGRLAVVVDDLGNDSQALARVLAIAEPLSGAVLPGLPRSADTARSLARSGKEVLLHLPMEPLESREKPGPGLLRASMSAREISELLDHDLADVPGATGVNNHMGSKGTADRNLMNALMAILRKKSLYFLDSRTTEWTTAEEAARQFGVPFLSRGVFLDDVPREEAIQAALERAAAAARQNGFSVAIGHPHGPTLSVLERQMSRLAAEDVTPVFVSDLLRTTPAERP
jgi:polysaccharide deacetylase 2 family uncharacterized protein YibQ